METIHDRIHKRRLELGYTLLYVAEKLGVKEATMQRYESGAIKNIKHDTIVELSKILKCNPSYLMGWTNDPCFSEDDTIKLYYRLDDIDKAEIRGLIKGMLRAEKYNSLKKKITDDITDTMVSSFTAVTPKMHKD